MEAGVHIPLKSQFETLNISLKELDENYRDVSCQSAEVIPDTNQLGNPVTRSGTKNGLSLSTSGLFPDSYFASKVAEFNTSSFFVDPEAPKSVKSKIDSFVAESTFDLSESDFPESGLASSLVVLTISQYENDLESTVG